MGATLALGCSSSTGPTRAGPPTTLHRVTGDAQTGVEGQTLPVPLTVQVLDDAGRGVPGVPVDWHVMPGGGFVVASALPTITDSAGLAIIFWQLGFRLDSAAIVIASCCRGATATFTAHAVLPLAQRIGIMGGLWQYDTVTRTLAHAIVARVLRADGKPDVGAIVGWGTSTPGGHFTPTFVAADSAGQASTYWTLGTVAGNQTGWASVRGLPQALFSATAFAGPPVRLVIAPNPLPTIGVIGTAVTVIPQTWDRYGNRAAPAVSLSAADSTIVGVVSPGPGVNPTVLARHHGSTWVTAQVGTLRDSAPVAVLGFTGVSTGRGHTCGLSLAGDAYCWGDNFLGAIGDGTQTGSPYPVLIGKGLGLQLPSADWHTCAVTAAGQAFCWGPDWDGELGDGLPTYATDTLHTLPVPVAGGHLFASIRAGYTHTCGRTTTGDAYCWGANDYAQLGRDTATNTCPRGTLHRCSNTPILVAGGLTFAQVSAGGFEHNCGVTANGAAYCWGINDSGQLGNDSTTETCGTAPAAPCSHAPRLVEGGLTFRSVAVGSAFTCGVTVTGDAYCWGWGLNGNLGNGSTVSSIVPVKVAGGLAFADVRTGFYSACGVTTTSKLYCWGFAYPATPTPVRPDLQFGAIAFGELTNCAITTANDLYCWDH